MFYTIHKFLKKNPVLSFLLFFVWIFIIGHSVSQINFKEDIQNMLPHSEDLKEANYVLKNAKMIDKIILRISLKDTTSNEENLMIQVSDSIAEELSKSINVSEVQHTFDESTILDLYDYIYRNIPVFIKETDYNSISKELTEPAIKTKIDQLYKNLQSPLSFITNKWAFSDPLGLSSNVLQKLSSLGTGAESYEITKGHIFSKDKKSLMLFVSPSNGSMETKQNEQLVSELEEIKSSVEKQYPTINFNFFGSAVVAVHNARIIKQDILFTVSLAVIFISIFLFYYFRDFSILPKLFIPVGLGVGSTLVLINYLQGELSLIALGIGASLVGISLDYGLHLFAHYRTVRSKKRLFKDLVNPLILSAITTSLAFYSMLFLKSEAMHDLGVFSGTSILICAIISIIVIPLFLNKKNTKTERKPNKIDGIASFKFNHGGKIFIGVSVLTLFFLWKGSLVGFEDDLSKMNYMPKELKLEEDKLMELNPLVLESSYVISTGDNIEMALRNNEKVADQLKKLQNEESIHKYTNVADFILSDSTQRSRITKWNAFWTSEKIELTKNLYTKHARNVGIKPKAFKQFFQLIEKKYEPIPLASQNAGILGQFKNDFVMEDENISAVLSLVSSQDEGFMANFSQQKNIKFLNKGDLTKKLVILLSREFDTLLSISSIVIFIVLLIAFGRFELALISYLPMLMSWVWTIGMMGVLGLKFDIFNIIITTFIFGLGIDYGIFITRGLVQKYAEGKDHMVSYKSAIILSAITTLFGVGVLIFSSHPALVSIGKLALIGIPSVLFLSLVIQPYLFEKIISSRIEKNKPPITLLYVINNLFAYSVFLGVCVSKTAVVIPLLMLLPNRLNGQKMFHYMIYHFSRLFFYLPPFLRVPVDRSDEESFSKPSVIIFNHHSMIDILLALSLNPKVILVTKEWVYRSPLLGPIVRKAGYICTENEFESQIPEIEKKISQGYSIIMFPQGKRSEDNKIGRFHKGAFYLAEKLNLDILPVILHGTHECLPKNTLFFQNTRLRIKILKRISIEDASFGTGYSARTKTISKWYKDEYRKYNEIHSVASFYFNRLNTNYKLKGPVLEWYVKSKVWIGNYFIDFHNELPKEGKITDIGCGYGYMTLLLSFYAQDRKMIGLDYDEEKIDIAKNANYNFGNVGFEHADIVNYRLENSKAFIISDVLHYLQEQEQENLIKRCVEKLEPEGTILIRDGDSSESEKHKKTLISEYISTRFQFNKTEHELTFISKYKIMHWAKLFDLDLVIKEKNKMTSNTLFVLRKKKESSYVRKV